MSGGGVQGSVVFGGAASATAAVRRAYVVYGAAVLSGLVALFVVDGTRWSAETAAVGAGIAPGIALGAACARARLRGWVFFVGSYLVGVAGVVLAGALDLPSSPQRVLVGLASGASLGAASSFFLLAPRADLWALWLPMGLHVAAAVEWVNHHGGVAAWQDDRLGLWDAPSTALVVLGVSFFVATVAARQAVSRARWLHRPVRVEAPATSGTHGGRAVLLVVALAGAGLLVTPFVLRTRAAPVRPSPDASASTTTTASTPSSAPSWQPPDGDALERALQRLWKTLAAVGDDVVKGVAGGAVVGVLLLPVLRRRRLAAWAAPDASLPPTERVRRRFVRALVALAESGVVVDGALQAPRGLVHAARDVVGGAAPEAVPGLHDAVAVWEQVTFRGRGLPDDAEQRMAAAMAAVVAWAEARRSPWQACAVGFRVPALPRA
jgi:hypothetical protein